MEEITELDMVNDYNLWLRYNGYIEDNEEIRAIYEQWVAETEILRR